MYLSKLISCIKKIQSRLEIFRRSSKVMQQQLQEDGTHQEGRVQVQQDVTPTNLEKYRYSRMRPTIYEQYIYTV